LSTFVNLKLFDKILANLPLKRLRIEKLRKMKKNSDKFPETFLGLIPKHIFEIL